jgi:hypothetical protein
MSNSRSLSFFGLTLVFLSALQVSAHGGGHEQAPIPADADWATRHMAGESLYLLSTPTPLTPE